jgi:copper transport protein
MGLELGGLPPSALLSAAPWATAAGTTAGPASAVAAFGLLLIAGRRRLPAWSATLGAVAVGASFGLTGHAASAQPRWLTAPALGFHALAASFWLGALLPLRWSLALPPRDTAAVLRRFSAVATLVVVGLILAGAVLAWIQLDGDVATLGGTAYGWRLLAKLALVAALLALAAVNRFWLTAGVAADRRGARGALRASLAADLGLGLAILAVTATFPFSPPPRALAPRAGGSAATAAPADGLAVVASAPGAQATLTLIPGRPGANRLLAWVTDLDGVPVRAREAGVAWSLPSAGIERSRAAAALPTPGVAVADGVVLPRAGRWRLRLDLLIDDFTKLTFEAEIDVR